MAMAIAILAYGCESPVHAAEPQQRPQAPERVHQEALSADQVRSAEADRVILRSADASVAVGFEVFATGREQVVFHRIAKQVDQQSKADSWYWLASDMATGWARASDVIGLGDAISYLNLVIQQQPQSAWGYMARGSVRLAEGDLELAIIDLQKSIQLDQTGSLAYTDLGRIRFLRGEKQLALSLFTDAIRLQRPSSQLLARSYLNRGAVLAGLQEYERAVADFKRAIEYEKNIKTKFTAAGDPGDRQYSRVLQCQDEAWLFLGDAELAQGNTTAATYDYGNIMTSTGIAASKTSLGNRSASVKDYDAARTFFEQALASDPSFVPAYVGQARLIMATAWQAAASAGTSLPAPAKFQELIEKLKDAVAYSPREEGCRKLLGSAPGSTRARVTSGTIAAYSLLSWYQAASPYKISQDPTNAVGNGRIAAGLTFWGNPDPLNSLAAAYARSNSFEGAFRTQRDAVKLLPADSPLLDAYTSRLVRYQTKNTVEETSPPVMQP
jgi:tetratricopeptide (TPR) repeat protein